MTRSPRNLSKDLEPVLQTDGRVIRAPRSQRLENNRVLQRREAQLVGRCTALVLAAPLKLSLLDNALVPPDLEDGPPGCLYCGARCRAAESTCVFKYRKACGLGWLLSGCFSWRGQPKQQSLPARTLCMRCRPAQLGVVTARRLLTHSMSMRMMERY